jgi:hypothetical protein
LRATHRSGCLYLTNSSKVDCTGRSGPRNFSNFKSHKQTGAGARWGYGGYRLLAGAHRLTAFRELGIERISANIVELDDLHAELVELDENLARNELSAAERSLAVARQPRVWSPDAGLHRLPYELASFFQ